VKTREILVFGYAARAEPPAAKQKMRTFAALLGKMAGVDVNPDPSDSYEELAKRAYKRAVDLAWMPPLPFIALERKKRAIPLVTHHRGGSTQFHAVIVVRGDTRIRSPQGLKGKRAAWVDPHSAAGFVVPRVQLAALGLDPRTSFAEERFYGTHEAVIRAVVGGRADFGATYARVDRAGEVVHGPWADLPGAEEATRVLAAFGSIPSDVLVARSDLDDDVRERVTRALRGICHDVEGSMLVRDIFGVHEFRPWTAAIDARYEPLRSLAADAHASGLLDTKRIPSA
jgi:phosphate/phosphite/phosphonate ABC transporter binding protein